MSQTVVLPTQHAHHQATNRATAHRAPVVDSISTRSAGHSSRTMTSAAKVANNPQRQPVLYGSDLVIAHPTRKRTIKSRQAIHRQKQHSAMRPPHHVASSVVNQTTSPVSQRPQHTACHTPPTTHQPVPAHTLAPTEIEPPSIGATFVPHHQSRFTQALANEQTNDNAAEAALAAALPITSSSGAEALMSQSATLPQSDVWWPPAEPVPVLSLPHTHNHVQPHRRTPLPHQTIVHQSKNRGDSVQKTSTEALSSTRSHRGRLLSLVGAITALLLLGGYVTYRNIPSISTHIAASQAGVRATFPSYQPSGYRLAEPVSYQSGSVSMKFAANAAPQSFTLTQSRSDWDSSAVLANYVLPILGRNFATTASRGLTIYSTNNAAAWVNGGVLYTIKGNATLSSDQVQRIAMSL